MRTFTSLLLLATAAGKLAAQDSTPPRAVKIRRQPNVITAEEIAAVEHESANVYELIQRLRPAFLHSRGPNTFGNAAGKQVPTARVVIDGTPRGEIDLLRQTPTMMIREIRYLNAADASTQFGTGFSGGAILLTSR